MAVHVMQYLALCLLAMALTSLARQEMDINLRHGVTTGLIPGVTWISRLTGNKRRYECDRQGVLKLTFSPQRQRAQINMTFAYSKGFTFNVGDSRTNNGWAGDANTQDNDAEVHSVNQKIFFYGRDMAPGKSYGLLHAHPNFVGVQPYSTVSLNVKDELATADNGHQFLYINSYKLFALNGQPDKARGGVNYDVYLGMNRVVSGAYRSGSGLCHVRVKFFPS